MGVAAFVDAHCGLAQNQFKQLEQMFLDSQYGGLLDKMQELGTQSHSELIHFCLDFYHFHMCGAVTNGQRFQTSKLITFLKKKDRASSVSRYPKMWKEMHEGE